MQVSYENASSSGSMFSKAAFIADGNEVDMDDPNPNPNPNPSPNPYPNPNPTPNPNQGHEARRRCEEARAEEP